MDVREAIARAKSYVTDVFAEQSVAGLRLEEVEFDDERDRWNITISFVRDLGTPLDRTEQFELRQRVYKAVSLSDETGRMISIKNRDVVA